MASITLASKASVFDRASTIRFDSCSTEGIGTPKVFGKLNCPAHRLRWLE
jgi:hypothetical protein